MYGLLYRCAACHSFIRHYYLKSDPQGHYVMKVGQEHLWDITLDSELAKALDPHACYYKRGLISESQSYGIGAFAYYRRIVEEIIDGLLDSIADLLSADDKQKYETALAQIKATHVVQDKINLVKDLLPSILRPEGMNPLSSLHAALSEGLHNRTDEECMEDAMAIREVLVFLVNQVAVAKTSSQKFTDSMRKLLERKGKQEKNKDSSNGQVSPPAESDEGQEQGELEDDQDGEKR